VRGRKALKVVKMWANKTLVTVWNRWIKSVAEIKRLRGVLNRVVKRWTHGCLANAQEKWRHEVVRGRKVLKVVKRWTYTSLAAAWSRWIDSVDDVKRSKTITNRVVKRWFNLTLTESLGKWHHEVVRGRKTLKVVKRWTNKSLAAAWSRWMESVDEVKRLRDVLNRVVNRWFNRTLTESLGKWHHEVVRGRETLKVVKGTGDALYRRELPMFKNRACSKVMGHWKECVSEIRRLRVIANRVVKLWIYRTLKALETRLKTRRRTSFAHGEEEVL
jgi:hypothetical protein